MQTIAQVNWRFLACSLNTIISWPEFRKRYSERFRSLKDEMSKGVSVTAEGVLFENWMEANAAFVFQPTGPSQYSGWYAYILLCAYICRWGPMAKKGTSI